jgi:ribose-phosphate pyrophosphokinase
LRTGNPNNWDAHASNHSHFMVFTGNANIAMATEIAQHLGTTLGAADVGRFSDGEVTVEIKQNVRARDVFVVQPPAPRPTTT